MMDSEEEGPTRMECDSSLPELDPELAEARKNDGNAAYKAGLYEEALTLYSQAVYHNPNSAVYYSNRSAALMMLDRYQEALDDCTQAIKLDDTYVKGYLRAAKCHLMLGNPSLSIDYYNKVLKVERRNRQALSELEVSRSVLDCLNTATAAMEKNHYSKAVVMLQRCLDHAPQCVIFRSQLAEALVFSKSYSEAHAIANDLLKGDRNNATAMYVKAMSYYYQDVEDRAMQFFQQALRVDPDHTKSRLALKKVKLLLRKKEEGNALFREGRHKEAYAVYSEALEVDPFNCFTNAKLYCNRALVGSKMSKMEEAIEDCTSAIRLDPNYIRAYERRAKLYQDTDQHDEAVRDLEFVLRKEPSAENRAAVKDAKRLEKLAKRKNYYKILNISRGATEVEIKRAYKKSALLHHPDRHATADDATRGEEEGIFKDVSEAYSVLSDPRKKARYDSGQDLDEVTMDFDPSSLFSSMFGGGFSGFGGGGGGGGGGGFGGGGGRHGGGAQYFFGQAF